MTSTIPKPFDDNNGDRSLPRNWKDELLDHQLPSESRMLAEQLLLDDATERDDFAQLSELDATLRRHLSPGQFDLPAFFARLDESSVAPSQPTQVVGSRSPDDSLSCVSTVVRRTQRRSTVPVLLAMVSLVVLAAIVRQPIDLVSGVAGTKTTGSLPPGALLVRATGPVTVHSPNRLPETIFVSMKSHQIPSGATIRTAPGVLCELDLPMTGKTRLQEQTEVVVETSGRLQLVTGMIWCRADGPDGLTVKVPASGSTGVGEQTASPAFICPTNSVSSWNTEFGITTCQSLSRTSVEIKIPGQSSCTVAPMEQIQVEGVSEVVKKGTADRLSALSWQLPLLLLGNADDPELQDVLQQVLARIGKTKMSAMYDQQIRDLGPAGTIPLIAFVRSKQSLTSNSRLDAMQIIADLAPLSAKSDIESLLTDDDPEIRRLAEVAICRLEGQ